MIRPTQEKRRRGTVLPIVAVSIFALVGCVAMAVDIGLVAQARTEMQDALDASLLAGVRQFDGTAATNNNAVAAINTAYTILQANTMIGDFAKTTDLTNFEIGYYAYTSGAFAPTWTDAVSGPGFDPGPAPSGQNYGAMRMSMQRNQYTVFGKAFGINSFQINIDNATAIHRPRDVAIVLDFSGSMCFGCLHNNAYVVGMGAGSMQSANYDPHFPRFGPWSLYPLDDPAAPSGLASISPMQMLQAYTDGVYMYAPSNITYGTPNHGGPIVNDFCTFWGGSWTTRCWSSGITAFTNTYPDVTTYNPLSTTNPTVMPAPKELTNQAIAEWTGTSWFGDKWLYNKTNPSNPPVPGDYSKTVQEYVNFMNAQGLTGGNSIPDPTKKYTNSPTNTQGGGMWWEANGYEGATGKTFCGYTMGPAYYGKTFYMWPPDPKAPQNCTSGTTYLAAGETPDAAKIRGYVPGDWRVRFFNSPDNNNSLYWNTSDSQWRDSSAPTVNYTEVINWIAGGPQVFPTSLFCGRVLYYSAIPTTIPSSGGTSDQIFWRNYIDYVLGTGSYSDQNYLYGRNSSHTWTNPKTGTTLSWGPIQVTNYLPGGSTTPYMNYADNPVHPRAQFWFGPLTMVAFMQHYVSAAGGNDSFMPGACHEAQAWELKAAVQSALADIQKNHPNDWVSLTYFSSNSGYNQPRTVMSNDYTTPSLCLWYPYRISGQAPNVYLASTPNLGSGAGFIRPCLNGGSWPGPITDQGTIPVAHNGTCYDMGLKVAFNQFSSNSSAPSSGGQGRQGARKLVIFETDGVVNTTAGGSINTSGGAGMSYYSTNAQIGTTAGSTTGDSTAAVAVITNMCGANGWGSNCHVHCIGFGDLLEPSAPAARRTMALNVLSAMQGAGKTSNPIEGYKIITGTYQNRIDSLKTAFQRIMQGDIQIALTQ